MIQYHYHTLAAPHRVGPHLLPAGTRCCHVYATSGKGELLAWGRVHGFTAEWLHDANGFLHFDAWDTRLASCGPAVDEATFLKDVAAQRHRRRGTGGGRPCCHQQIDLD